MRSWRALGHDPSSERLPGACRNARLRLSFGGRLLAAFIGVTSSAYLVLIVLAACMPLRPSARTVLTRIPAAQEVICETILHVRGACLKRFGGRPANGESLFTCSGMRRSRPWSRQRYSHCPTAHLRARLKCSCRRGEPHTRTICTRAASGARPCSWL